MVESYPWALIAIHIILGLFAIWRFRSAYNQRTKQFEYSNKVESAKLIFNIESRFLEDKNRDVSKRMDEHLYNNTPFDIGTDEQDPKRRALYNYLSELEMVCQYHEEGILTTSQVYELLGYSIIDIMRIDSIVDLIVKERTEKDRQGDLLDNLQKTFGIMVDYQNEKFQKGIPDNLKIFVKEKFEKNEGKKSKSEIDSSSQDKTQPNSEP